MEPKDLSQDERRWVRVLLRVMEIDAWIRVYVFVAMILAALVISIWYGGVLVWVMVGGTLLWVVGMIWLIKPSDGE